MFNGTVQELEYKVEQLEMELHDERTTNEDLESSLAHYSDLVQEMEDDNEALYDAAKRWEAYAESLEIESELDEELVGNPFDLANVIADLEEKDDFITSAIESLKVLEEVPLADLSAVVDHVIATLREAKDV